MERIQAKKKFGQNFLKNETILKNIADSVAVQENDLIIEIGPGMGALTKHLKNKNSYLLCYEIDKRMIDYLNVYQSEKCKIIYDDFLNHDLKKDSAIFSYQKIKVVANIPYYITSPIILKLIDLNSIDEIVLLVQKEVANRICAKENHKEYNALTLLIAMNYEAQILFDVDKKNFIPVPKVDSAVIKLTHKLNSAIHNQEFYKQLIRKAFQNKRKTLKNNLKEYDWNKVYAILNELGYKETIRAEEIKPKDFIYLATKLEK